MNQYNRFGAAFSLLNRSAQEFFARRIRQFHISPAQQAYLLALEPDGEINQDEIAHRHQVDKANAARAVATLERLGYVKRRRAPHDRRQWLVSLTPRGAEVRTAVERIMREWVGILEGSVSTGTWRTMVTGLETMARAAAHTADNDRSALEA